MARVPIFYDTKEKVSVPFERLNFRKRIIIFFTCFCILLGFYIISFIHENTAGLYYEYFAIDTINSFFNGTTNILASIQAPELLIKISSGLTTLFSMGIISAILLSIIIAIIITAIISLIFTITETHKEREKIKANVMFE